MWREDGILEENVNANWHSSLFLEMPRDNFGFEVERQMDLLQHTLPTRTIPFSPLESDKRVCWITLIIHTGLSQITPNLTSKPHLFAFLLIASYLYLYEGEPY